jgi:hypothetical protein
MNRAEINARYEKSVFRLPIENTLGITAIEARAQLKSFALQKPAEYTALRNEVYIETLKYMTKMIHKVIWDLLALGVKPGVGEQATRQINIPSSVPGEGPIPWATGLPENEIGRVANGMAESMMESFKDIMERVLPDDYKRLADDKLMNISKVNGVDRALPGGN